MGRPKIKEEKKRVSLNVTLSANAIELAEKTDNKSKFLDKSVLSMAALSQLVSQLRTRGISLEDAMEEVEDLVDVWESEFDETEDYQPITD